MKINSLFLPLAVYLVDFYLSVHNSTPTFFVTPMCNSREEQRQRISFSKGDGISELSDKLEGSFGEAQRWGFILVSSHHTGQEGSILCATFSKGLDSYPKLGTPTGSLTYHCLSHSACSLVHCLPCPGGHENLHK